VTADTHQQRVLLIGKSQRVLDDSVAGLRALDYVAEATNDFSDIGSRYGARVIDLVVFGGQVPPDRKAALREEIGAANPHTIFVQGLAGIPGLIVDQVRGGLTAGLRNPGSAPIYAPDDRSVRLALGGPADVKVTVWWQTSFVPPDPTSDSLSVFDGRLPAGDHAIQVPADVPAAAAFATVQIDGAIHTFSIGEPTA
jgi:hypothetical protein